MKKPRKGKSPTRSKMTVDPTADGIESLLRQPELRGPDQIYEFEGEVREALSTHLHDLMNSLWPAATRIELLISEESCPPKFRETLEQLARCVSEAMTIAAEASTLVDVPPRERTRDSLNR